MTIFSYSFALKGFNGELINCIASSGVTIVYDFLTSESSFNATHIFSITSSGTFLKPLFSFLFFNSSSVIFEKSTT